MIKEMTVDTNVFEASLWMWSERNVASNNLQPQIRKSWENMENANAILILNYRQCESEIFPSFFLLV